jgi:hypothetical protein
MHGCVVFYMVELLPCVANKGKRGNDVAYVQVAKVLGGHTLFGLVNNAGIVPLHPLLLVCYVSFSSHEQEY